MSGRVQFDPLPYKRALAPGVALLPAADSMEPFQECGTSRHMVSSKKERKVLRETDGTKVT